MRVAQLTAKGRGAIASIAIEGPQAVPTVAVCFRRHSSAGESSLPIGRVLVGVWLAPQANPAVQRAGEELVVCRTAEQRVEIHCHGGQAAVKSILDDLQARGARVVGAFELEDACAAGSVTSAAALRALAEAATERTALILLDQYHGALDQAVGQLRSLLASQQLAAARQVLADLLRFARLGLHLSRPWQVVLAGPPNVGKSSLINALVGFQRVVVFDTPGTTRDVVTAATAIEGWPIELSDTAGLRESADPLESLGMRRAVTQLQQADLVLWICDATHGSPQAVGPLAEEWPESLWVVNKWDQAQPALPRHSRWWPTSALTGTGLAELTAAIAKCLVPHVPPPGSAVPFTASQVRALRDAEAAAMRDDVTAALALLSGEFASGSSTGPPPLT